MVQNRSEPFGTGLKAELNPWNQCILVRSGLVTFVVWFWFEPVPNRTVATLQLSGFLSKVLCSLTHIPTTSNQIQPLCHHHHYSLLCWCHLLHLSTRSEDLHILVQNFLAAVPWFCEICKIWRVWVGFFFVIILLDE